MKEKTKEWLAKYYPIHAEDTIAVEALDHSILKWEGLQLDVLKGYDLKLENKYLIEIDTNFIVMPINDKSCALCFHYFDDITSLDLLIYDRCYRCYNCPIFLATGRDCSIEYEYHFENPEKMLHLLKKVKAIYDGTTKI